MYIETACRDGPGAEEELIGRVPKRHNTSPDFRPHIDQKYIRNTFCVFVWLANVLSLARYSCTCVHPINCSISITTNKRANAAASKRNAHGYYTANPNSALAISACARISAPRAHTTTTTVELLNGGACCMCVCVMSLCGGQTRDRRNNPARAVRQRTRFESVECEPLDWKLASRASFVVSAASLPCWNY